MFIALISHGGWIVYVDVWKWLGFLVYAVTWATFPCRQGDSELKLQFGIQIKKWQLLSLWILVDFTHRLDNIVLLWVRHYWLCLRNFDGKPEVLTAWVGSLNTVFKHLHFALRCLKVHSLHCMQRNLACWFLSLQEYQHLCSGQLSFQMFLPGLV